MPKTDKQTPLALDFYTVAYDGEPVLVNQQIDVAEVPDDAPLLMEAGGGSLKMYAATALDAYPLSITFPVYIESDEMASLVPVESALRRANWTIPSDSAFNDKELIDGLKKAAPPSR